MKLCHKCGLDKPVSNFNNHKKSKDGLYLYCKECVSRIGQKYYINNRNKILGREKTKRATPKGKQYTRDSNTKWMKTAHGRERHRVVVSRYKSSFKGRQNAIKSGLKKYGLTLQGYELILVNQGGRCACCPTTPQDQGKRLFVDHNHKTGIVRGLLCHKCNVSLGLLNENLETLASLSLYLQKHDIKEEKQC